MNKFNKTKKKCLPHWMQMRDSYFLFVWCLYAFAVHPVLCVWMRYVITKRYTKCHNSHTYNIIIIIIIIAGVCGVGEKDIKSQKKVSIIFYDNSEKFSTLFVVVVVDCHSPSHSLFYVSLVNHHKLLFVRINNSNNSSPLVLIPFLAHHLNRRVLLLLLFLFFFD